MNPSFKLFLPHRDFAIGPTAARAADTFDTGLAIGSLKSLMNAVRVAGLVDTLRSGGPWTLFAPNNHAWAELSPLSLDTLLRDRPRLVEILKFHIVPGLLRTKSAMPDTVTTAHGQSLAIKKEEGKLYVDNALVVRADVDTANGLIHIIDTVLLPEPA